MEHNVLFIVTSHDRISADKLTGLWFEEFAVPYAIFQKHGYRVTVASPLGGSTPIDPGSAPNAAKRAVHAKALQALQNTLVLATVNPEEYDAVFLPGGYGTMFDLPVPVVGTLVGRFADAGKVVAAVCHGPAGLIEARLANGMPLVAGHRLTAFTNAEEDAAQLSAVMPFLLQDKLTQLGGQFEEAALWVDHVIVDGLLVTGQNPQSSGSAAQAVVKLLAQATEAA